MIARLYAVSLRAAETVHARRLMVGAIGAPLVLLGLVAINQLVLLDFPNSGDEYVYLYQAQTLAAGRYWNPPVVPPELFTTNYIVQEPTRTFGSFPLGWPLLLGVALAAHVPAWLVNPVLGVVTLALVWALGTRLHSPRVGVIAASLVAVSPFFAFNAASYFSHTWCGVLVLAAAVLASRPDRQPWWVPASIGLLLGWAILARYFTGVACAIPIVWWLLRPGAARARTLALVVAGGLPWIAVLMAYNTVFTGSPWHLTTTPLTLTRWFADGFAMRGADILATHLLRHLLWTPPALVVAYVVFLATAPRVTRRRGLDWMLVVMAFGLYAYTERGGNQYGPRFHYEVFPFVAIVVAANLFRERDYVAMPLRDRRLFAALAVSVAVMPLAFVGHAVIERQVIRERMDPYTMATVADLHQALVLIGGRVGTARSMAAFDLTRNGIDHEGAVLYGLDLGAAADCAAITPVTGRATYLYAWDRAAARGVLRPLACP